jgi:hypothetical protein
MFSPQEAGGGLPGLWYAYDKVVNCLCAFFHCALHRPYIFVLYCVRFCLCSALAFKSIKMEPDFKILPA